MNMGERRTILVNIIIIVTFLMIADCLQENHEEKEKSRKVSKLPFTDRTTVQRSLGNWTTNVSYTYIKNTLNITFVPADEIYNYHKYKVILKWKGDSNVYSRSFRRKVAITDAKWPLTVATFGITVVDPFKETIIEIIPMIKNIPEESEKIILEPVPLFAYKRGSLDCSRWNLNISAEPDRYNASIFVKFAPTFEYKSCFEKFMVNLSCVPCDLFSTKKVLKSKEILFNDIMIATFSNLPYGNYCIVIYPHHKDCPFMGRCGPDFSTSVELKELENPAITLPVVVKEIQIDILLTVVIVGLVVCLFVLCFITWKILQQYQLVSVILQILKGSKDPYPRPDPTDIKTECYECNETHKETSVVSASIIYAQDCENQNKVVMALARFLEECCNVQTIIDTKTAEIFVNDVAWVKNAVNYNCSKTFRSNDEKNVSKKIKNVNKKIIILETDSAVKLYLTWRDYQTLQYKNYSHLNDLFICELNAILSNMPRSNNDYCHLLVIRFNYTSQGCIDMVPNRRFYIPNHLVELYNGIFDKQVCPESDETLLKEWEKQPSYIELKEAVEAMEEYVNKNPKYVDTLFVSNN